MFSYYGSKSKIIHLYPPPEYDRIVEPFAGSARYALHYAEREVVLLEIDTVVYGIWDWLINDATVRDIQGLPKLKRGDDLRKMKQLHDQMDEGKEAVEKCDRKTEFLEGLELQEKREFSNNFSSARMDFKMFQEFMRGM